MRNLQLAVMCTVPALLLTPPMVKAGPIVGTLGNSPSHSVRVSARKGAPSINYHRDRLEVASQNSYSFTLTDGDEAQVTWTAPAGHLVQYDATGLSDYDYKYLFINYSPSGGGYVNQWPAVSATFFGGTLHGTSFDYVSATTYVPTTSGTSSTASFSGQFDATALPDTIHTFESITLVGTVAESPLFSDTDVVGFSMQFYGETTGPDAGQTLSLISASSTSSVPEPTSLALLASGAIGLLAYRRRQSVPVTPYFVCNQMIGTDSGC